MLNSNETMSLIYFVSRNPWKVSVSAAFYKNGIELFTGGSKGATIDVPPPLVLVYPLWELSPPIRKILDPPLLLFCFNIVK